MILAYFAQQNESFGKREKQRKVINLFPRNIPENRKESGKRLGERSVCQQNKDT